MFGLGSVFIAETDSSGDSSPSPPQPSSSSKHDAKRRKVDVDLSSIPSVQSSRASTSPEQTLSTLLGASSSSSPDVVMIDVEEEEEEEEEEEQKRPQRKAKAEANQRVAAMANSLMDNSEVGSKRRTNANSARAASKSASSKASSRVSAIPSHRKRPAPASGDSDDEVQVLEREEPDIEEPDQQDDAAAPATTAMEVADEPRLIGKRAGLSRAAALEAVKHLGQKSTTRGSAAAAAAVSSANNVAVVAAASSSAAAKVKKPRDLRRDKRASGFGAWKTVHWASIPAMTFEGYEDLARQALEPETQEQIKKSQVYTPAGTDCYHRDPTAIITGKAEMPLTLMRRVDTKYGREEYKVQASRTIEKKEVVTFLGGRLMEQVKANKQTREDWNQHFHMKKEWLKEFFEYNGVHDLVVSTKDHRCIGSYIRGPEERTDGEVGANLKADVYFEPNSGLFIVIYYAVERIGRGKEVFCMPFLGDWHDRCHREMFLYSRISHWHHKWLMRLEQKLLEEGIEFDQGIDPNMRPIILTADQEEKFLAIPGMDQGVLPPPLPMEQTMILADVQAAMDYCGCVYSAKAMQKDISEETQGYIDAVGTFIPDYIEICSEGSEDEGGEPTWCMKKYYIDYDEMMELIEHGFRQGCLELREELGIHSPVRHFTPPNYRSFCVVATAPIPKGTFVFAYAGVITEEVENRDSAYVYMMEAEQIRRTVKSYHGPDLCLDALKLGNISRFVNDNHYRAGESDQEGATANLETQFLFVNGTIHLGFYTTRDIEPKEELVSQYGEDYWKTINKQLIDEHKRYYDYANCYRRKLESLLYRHKKTLPTPPPDDWQTPEEEIFREKPLPYPKLRSPDDDLLNDDGTHQVERILQWLNTSSANNSWIKENQVIHCHELIAEFEESERNRLARKNNHGKKSTHKKKPASSAASGAASSSASKKK